jgi:hypothetical protein
MRHTDFLFSVPWLSEHKGNHGTLAFLNRVSVKTKGEKEMNLRKMLKKSERGQALAEYAVLMPPVLLIGFMVLIPVASHANYIFCKMVYALNPNVSTCEEWLVEDVVVEEEIDDECIVFNAEEGSSQCSQDDNCVELPGLNVGSFESSADIEAFIIKAGVDYHIYESGLTEDGCYMVNIDGPNVSWERYGSGPHCKDVSHSQVWNTPLCE